MTRMYTARRFGPAAVALLLAVAVPVACTGRSAGETARATIALTSAAFQADEPIPARHTCAGKNLSPALSWDGVPDTTKALALVCEDPDAPAGTWTHWVLYDIPADSTGLPEGVPGDSTLARGGVNGVNDFHRIGYGGPCPPPGKAHHYVFTLYALDAPTGLAPGATRKQLLAAIDGHVIARGRIVGTFRR